MPVRRRRKRRRRRLTHSQLLPLDHESPKQKYRVVVDMTKDY
jgi:hypothetical protein